jgi:hypothetical protein
MHFCLHAPSSPTIEPDPIRPSSWHLTFVEGEYNKHDCAQVEPSPLHTLHLSFTADPPHSPLQSKPGDFEQAGASQGQFEELAQLFVAQQSLHVKCATPLLSTHFGAQLSTPVQSHWSLHPALSAQQAAQLP